MDPTLEMDSAKTGPLLAQANLLRIRTQWHEAVETCVRVLRIHPGNADAHSLLGDIHRDQGMIDDAIQWYRMAADLRPSGPDVEKLERLERERDRRAALSGSLSPAAVAGLYDPVTGGTTQLMGHSPKRWLNVLTIASVCFLAATVTVLIGIRSGPFARGAGSSAQTDSTRTVDLASRHALMPTAETGVILPRINPNGATILPLGEQPKPQQKVHRTGDGLEPDRTNNPQPSSAPSRGTLPSRVQPSRIGQATLPAFGQQARRFGPTLSQTGRRSREIPPAPVRMVTPLSTSFGVAGEGAQPGQERQPTARPQPGLPANQPVVERDPSQEREPPQGLGGTTPAQQNRAGEQIPFGALPPER